MEWEIWPSTPAQGIYKVYIPKQIHVVNSIQEKPVNDFEIGMFDAYPPNNNNN